MSSKRDTLRICQLPSVNQAVFRRGENEISRRVKSTRHQRCLRRKFLRDVGLLWIRWHEVYGGLCEQFVDCFEGGICNRRLLPRHREVPGALNPQRGEIRVEEMTAI